ncbi:MetQ/NlpA family ABC transporter substrate-binding protein [Treponema sp. Marseille-Q4132]|uniref:MetQ/NlpA family ABC transporter substrate-binding protein n=1 Tax=Treponema sp. Marseille-Q4132 TaxID=2766701 RepID=UPI001652EB13|nr:MetQ/NlpA family ABC transporter substrate-binding protein [Treponema sp. Marseille-Q4132]QNL97820.1 MetQ/NlpA family ABC transporter substrate-binding protein [Treponema sp. Marseille-Q4132]
MKIIKKLVSAVFAGALIAGGAFAQKKGAATVKVGVCGSSNDQWKAVQYVLDSEKSGIKIQLVEFSAYNLPNEALNSGDIHLNAFQHKAYLNNDASKNGYKITAIGDTLIAPLTLYSKKYQSVDDIKKAAGTNGTKAVRKNALRLAIPSDGTNLSRGIKLLEAAGFIEVNPSAGYTPEMKDITKLVYNIEVVPQTANTLPQTLNDYAGATINGTYAIPSGFVPSRDGLIIEKQSSSGDNPYVNVIVARTKDKDNALYAKIVKAYQSQTVAEYIFSKYKESYFPAFTYGTIDANTASATVKKVDAAVRW